MSSTENDTIRKSATVPAVVMPPSNQRESSKPHTNSAYTTDDVVETDDEKDGDNTDDESICRTDEAYLPVKAGSKRFLPQEPPLTSHTPPQMRLGMPSALSNTSGPTLKSIKPDMFTQIVQNKSESPATVPDSVTQSFGPTNPQGFDNTPGFESAQNSKGVVESNNTPNNAPATAGTAPANAQSRVSLALLLEASAAAAKAEEYAADSMDPDLQRIRRAKMAETDRYIAETIHRVQTTPRMERDIPMKPIDRRSLHIFHKPPIGWSRYNAIVQDPVLNGECQRLVRGTQGCGRECDAKFSTLITFAKHIDEVHNITFRPFLCPHERCPWAIIGFHERSECTRHIRTKHYKAMYACGYHGCQKVYNRSDAFRRHVRQAHANPTSRYNRISKLASPKLNDQKSLADTSVASPRESLDNSNSDVGSSASDSEKDSAGKDKPEGEDDNQTESKTSEVLIEEESTSIRSHDDVQAQVGSNDSVNTNSTNGDSNEEHSNTDNIYTNKTDNHPELQSHETDNETENETENENKKGAENDHGNKATEQVKNDNEDNHGKAVDENNSDAVNRNEDIISENADRNPSSSEYRRNSAKNGAGIISELDATEDELDIVETTKEGEPSNSKSTELNTEIASSHILNESNEIQQQITAPTVHSIDNLQHQHPHLHDHMVHDHENIQQQPLNEKKPQFSPLRDLNRTENDNFETKSDIVSTATDPSTHRPLIKHDIR